VDVEHVIIVKVFEEEIISLLKAKEKKQPTKTNNNCVLWVNFNFFPIKRFIKKKGCATKRIFRRLGPFDYQKKITYSICENMWLKHLILRLCSRLNFPSKRQFSKDILPRLIEKDKSIICSSYIGKLFFYNNWL